MSETTAKIIFLTDRDHPDKVVAHACGVCRIVQVSEQEADKCCRCQECQANLEHPGHASRRGQNSYPPYYCSDACEKLARGRQDAEYAKSRSERIARHPSVLWSNVTTPLCDDGDDFYHELDEFVERYLDQLDGPEDFALNPTLFTCNVIPMALDIESALESAAEEYHEDAEWDCLDEIHDFVKDWNEKQSSSSWSPRCETIDFTGFPWLEHCGEGESWAPLRAEIERQLAEVAR